MQRRLGTLIVDFHSQYNALAAFRKYNALVLNVPESYSEQFHSPVPE